MEDFVTFDLAVKLKEKGFPIKTKTEGKFGLTKLKEVEILPTISQVLKWLREEKQVDILIDIPIKYDDNLNRIRQYTSKILTPKSNKPIYACSVFNYEKAHIHAIEYVINNLI